MGDLWALKGLIDEGSSLIKFLKNALNLVGYHLYLLSSFLFADDIVVYLCCGRKSLKHLDGPNSSFPVKHHHLDVVIQLHLEDIMYVLSAPVCCLLLYVCNQDDIHLFCLGSCDLHSSHH